MKRLEFTLTCTHVDKFDDKKMRTSRMEARWVIYSVFEVFTILAALPAVQRSCVSKGQIIDVRILNIHVVGEKIHPFLWSNCDQW